MMAVAGPYPRALTKKYGFKLIFNPVFQLLSPRWCGLELIPWFSPRWREAKLILTLVIQTDPPQAKTERTNSPWQKRGLVLAPRQGPLYKVFSVSQKCSVF